MAAVLVITPGEKFEDTRPHRFGLHRVQGLLCYTCNILNVVAVPGKIERAMAPNIGGKVELRRAPRSERGIDGETIIFADKQERKLKDASHVKRLGEDTL